MPAPTLPIPEENDPVAIGTRSPIFNVAFCPSRARTCGLWMTLVSVSLINAVAVAVGIVTWKSVALRLASEFRLMPVEVLEVVDVVVVVDVVETDVLTFGCSVTPMLVGGLMPRVCDLSLL